MSFTYQLPVSPAPLPHCAYSLRGGGPLSLEQAQMVTTGVLGLQGVGLIAATDKVNVNLEQQLKVYIEQMENILALKLTTSSLIL
jgi:hypothetical protein